MRILIITQNDPFYLGKNIDYLLSHLPKDVSVIGCIVFEGSPFGKKYSSVRKLLETVKVFGFGFCMYYALKLFWSKIDKSSQVKSALKKWNVPQISLDKSINHTNSLRIIKELRPDLMISIAGNQIFKKVLLEIPSHGTLNLHTSLLPKYRGLMPTFWVLKNEEKVTGVSVFLVDEGIDSGPIVVQREVPINGETQKQLIEKTKHQGMIAIVEAIEKIKNHNENLIPNPHSEMSYYSFPQRSDVVDFKQKGKRFF